MSAPNYGWPFPHPQCAKCGKKVDTIEWMSDSDDLKQKVTVYCHGASETTEISVFDIQSGATFKAGIAFQPPAKALHSLVAVSPAMPPGTAMLLPAPRPSDDAKAREAQLLSGSAVLTGIKNPPAT